MANQCYDHCRSCVNLRCTKVPECPVERCENGCGVFLHGCKKEEHYEYTCPESIVSCICASYGCTQQMPRKKLTEHIQYCPASILECQFSYRRTKALKHDETTDLNYLGTLIDEQLLAVDQEKSSVGVERTNDLDIDVVNIHNCYTDNWRLSVKPPAFRQRSSKRVSNECDFTCTEFVRRDEFCTHWKNQHLDVQLNSSMCIHRCPMKMYGCTYGQINMVPQPPGANICFDKHSDMHSYLPVDPCVELDPAATPQPGSYVSSIEKKKELAMYGYGDEEESMDVLGQLPSEVLIQVISFLDSLSLWSLSQVNSYFRILCYDFVKKKGIVYGRWEKDEHSGLPWTHWVYTPPMVWSFSRVTSEVPGWMLADTPSLLNHMMSCDIYKSISKNPHNRMDIFKAVRFYCGDFYRSLWAAQIGSHYRKDLLPYHRQLHFK